MLTRTLISLLSLPLLLATFTSAQAQAQPRPAPAEAPIQPSPGPASSGPAQAQPRPRVYSCPKDNGVRYTTPNGITFELKCGQGTTAKRIDDTPKNSQKECADFCSEIPNCQSADWNLNSKNCARFSEYIPTIPMEGVNTWFPIEKRPEPEKVYGCPQDDGARYTTPNGVTFQLLCGRGTYASWLDGGITVPSQKACADACSELPNCQSCDWGASTGRCVRFGEYIPTVPNPAVNTWFPLEERGQPRPDREPRTPPACPASKIAVVESVNASFTVDGQCPDNDGKIFVTPQGTYFQVKCGSQNTASTGIGGRPLHDFAECMTACADIPECNSVQFSGGHPTWDCNFYGTGVEAVVADASKKKDSAVLIDPPTSDKADDTTLLCATECPLADGQTWDSPTGQKFHIDCCKRHGTIAISSTQTSSFTTCMTACASVLGCASVDWHQESGTCYLGKHSGEPSISVPGWSSAHSLGCAGACKKQGAAGCCSQSHTEL